MANPPKELTERPNQGDEQATDVLGDVLDTMRMATLMYGRFELGAPWGLQLPEGDAAHVLVTARGGARLEMKDGGVPVILSAGDLVLLPHGGARALRDAEGSPLYLIHETECPRARAAEPVRVGGSGARTTLVMGAFRFGSTPRPQLFAHLPHVIHISADAAAASPSLASTVQLFIAESASRAPGTTVVVNRLAEVLLVQALRTHIAGKECQEHGLRALTDPQIGKALALIHERPAEAWTVESLAAAVALSRSGFAARFSTLVGEPPLEYLARWRMTKAAQFLRESDLSLSEIATHVGYQSEASFNRAFKRWEGVAPGAYRRNRRSPGAGARAPEQRTPTVLVP